eukprot:575782-Rhodomonas_salina.1
MLRGDVERENVWRRTGFRFGTCSAEGIQALTLGVWADTQVVLFACVSGHFTTLAGSSAR